MIITGRIIRIQVNILHRLAKTTQHNYAGKGKMLPLIMPPVKTNAPATEKAGAIFLRDGFCSFHRIAGLAFNRTLGL
jgi:hypothetical protein